MKYQVLCKVDRPDLLFVIANADVSSLPQNADVSNVGTDADLVCLLADGDVFQIRSVCVLLSSFEC